MGSHGQFTELEKECKVDLCALSKKIGLMLPTTVQWGEKAAKERG